MELVKQNLLNFLQQKAGDTIKDLCTRKLYLYHAKIYSPYDIIQNNLKVINSCREFSPVTGQRKCQTISDFYRTAFAEIYWVVTENEDVCNYEELLHTLETEHKLNLEFEKEHPCVDYRPVKSRPKTTSKVKDNNKELKKASDNLIKQANKLKKLNLKLTFNFEAKQ